MAIVAELQAILQRLDNRIESAIATAAEIYGTAAGQDPYRGLYIGPGDVAYLLERPPLVPLFSPEAGHSFSPVGDRLENLQTEFGLSSFDLDLMAIALAPEIEPRYERLYAYLQDDVQCRRPSVNLALDLLCVSAADKLARRAHLGATAPLLASGLVRLVPNPSQPVPSLLNQFLILEAQVVDYLLGQASLDPRLVSCCSYRQPGSTEAPTALAEQTVSLAASGVSRFYFQGFSSGAKAQAALAVAAALDLPLLQVDLPKLDEPRLGLLTLHLRLHPALVYGTGLGQVDKPMQPLLAALVAPAVVSGEKPLPPEAADWLTVEFSMPDVEQRRRVWSQALGPQAPAAELAERFILDAEQIQAAAGQAGLAAQGQPTAADLFAAARLQSGGQLGQLTQKVTPVHRWEQLILPPDAQAQLLELCAQVRHRHRVFDQWGYGQRLSAGRGLNALFSGPPGTGKTTAAEVIAQELQLDLYRINLSQVVSKYIGETEKNLDRIFTAAVRANGILLFDEADALFGKRSEVKDAHDRYANIEIGYLLQKMEAHDGISILTTNLRQNLDEAFVRRLAFIVHFPAPDEAHRRKIWSCIWPEAVPLAADLDFDWLAQQFKLSGGNIKNIALAAAFLSAQTGGPVTMDHLLQAVRREYQKMGQTLTAGQLDYGKTPSGKK